MADIPLSVGEKINRGQTMADTIIPSEVSWIHRVTSKPATGLARIIVLNLLAKLNQGRIILREGGNTLIFGRRSSDFNLSATVSMKSPKAYTAMVFGGSVGAAEAFMHGRWKADDLTALIRIIIRNQIVFRDLERGFAALAAPFYKLAHFFRKNSLSGSRKNIVAHYDLGNDFYRLFLDQTMTYSCGIFENPDATMAQASIAKYERICRKLNLSEKDHVLEIGTGWGGFALHAVKHYGCRITTTTISDQQYTLAKRRFKEAGIDHKATLLKSDYRRLSGQFDKLVSIEMIEAVGHHYLGTFMAKCAELLTSTGVMLIQSITIADWAFEQHKKEVDFIKRYIFPGSCIPSVAAISNAMAGETDLRLFDLEDITPHYATTLRRWREKFLENLARIKALGFDQTFIRMWIYYLQYCEAGFEEKYLRDVHLLFAKPFARR
jgi:cyclopropane-fatty-acyl-phospholipid synthase